MKVYARVYADVVQEIIEPLADLDGNEYPIEARFTPELVAQMVDITGINPKPAQMWTYISSVFSPPKPYQPSPEEILTANTSIRDSLLTIATLAIAPLQDAVDLEDASSSEVASLKKWKQYRVAVNRVDLTKVDAVWPARP